MGHLDFLLGDNDSFVIGAAVRLIRTGYVILAVATWWTGKMSALKTMTVTDLSIRTTTKTESGNSPIISINSFL